MSMNESNNKRKEKSNREKTRIRTRGIEQHIQTSLSSLLYSTLPYSSLLLSSTLKVTKQSSVSHIWMGRGREGEPSVSVEPNLSLSNPTTLSFARSIKSSTYRCLTVRNKDKIWYQSLKILVMEVVQLEHISNTELVIFIDIAIINKIGINQKFENQDIYQRT